MIKYPDLFVASLLVAGQRDAQEMLRVVQLRRSRRATRRVRGHQETREPREPHEVQAANVSKIIAERKRIVYTTYVKGTCLPPEQAKGAVRDWLFAQSK